MPEYFDAPMVCDSMFATVCASAEMGMAASLRWARSSGYGHPLMLLDWEVGQLSPQMWRDVEDGLTLDAHETRVRYGSGPHVWVEGAALAHQAQSVLTIDSHAMPEHVVAAGFWDTLVLSSAFYMRGGQVKMTKRAHEKTQQKQFSALTYRGGLRPDDPTVPAFLYGVVLALDEAAARPPRPVKVPLQVHSGANRR